MRARQRRIGQPCGDSLPFRQSGHAQGTPGPPSATRKQRSENQLILSSISSGGRAASSSPRCSGLWIRGRQEKRSDLFGLRGATCGKLRTEKKTNIVANLLSDSTWNPDDFWLGISAPNAVRSSRAIPSRQHPSEYTYPEHDWTWVLHELVHGNGVTEEAHRRAGVHAFCACGEGVIPRPILWWCQNGASHRKNFDTPPLLGSCKCTTVHLERFQRHNNFRCTWVHLGIRGGYGNFERQEKRAL